MFSSSKSTYHRNRRTYKNNINLIFSFLQCALLNSVIFSSNFVFYLLKEYTMFSYFKVIYQTSRCTFKNKIKSHVFFTVRPFRFIFLVSKFVFYLLTQFTTFFLFQRYIYKKVHFQKTFKIPYFQF